MRQCITATSPASLALIDIISGSPRVTTGEIASAGSWSIVYIRNVLRFLRDQKCVESKRAGVGSQCRWWIAEAPAIADPTPADAPLPFQLRAPASVFHLGAML